MHFFHDILRVSLLVTATCLARGGDFCHLLVIFANNLDPDQDQQNVRPYLDPEIIFLKKLI